MSTMDESKIRCPKCGWFEEKFGGYFYTIALTETEVENMDSEIIREILDLKLEQAKREFSYKLGLTDGSHDLSRELDKPGDESNGSNKEGRG